MSRLFVGAYVSIATANQLKDAVAMVARRARDQRLDLRWVAPTTYHVTLKFLGETRSEAIGALGDALAAAVAPCAPFAMKCARIGGAPKLETARVVWAEVEPSVALSNLAAAVETAAVAFGFPAEARAFHPHVTLGRSREARNLREVVLPMAEQMFGTTEVGAISLIESTTNPSGSVYREVRKMFLGTSEKRTDLAAERQTQALDLGAHEVETDDGWPRTSDIRQDDF